MIRRAFAIVLLGGVFLASCLSPTLPLPPPDPPTDVTDAGDGYWQIRGDCPPGVPVIVRIAGELYGEDDDDQDGRYFIEVPGDYCQFAEVFFIADDTVTTSTGFYLVPTQQGFPEDNCH
jgi:hypothetical protein